MWAFKTVCASPFRAFGFGVSSALKGLGFEVLESRGP